MLALREVTRLTTPAGTPASSIARRTSAAVSGVSVAGLTTLVQPAASAGPSLRVIIAAGKFHGVIAAVTPTGCLQHEHAVGRVLRRHDLAVDALRLAGEPLEEARGVLDLADRLGERLALLGRHHGADLVGALAHQRRRRGRGSAPRSRAAVDRQAGECRGGGVDRRLHVLLRARSAPMPTTSPVAGFVTSNRSPDGRLDPPAADQKLLVPARDDRHLDSPSLLPPLGRIRPGS